MSLSKIATHTISIYENCMESNFFSKKYFKSVFFCHQSVQLFSKNRRNGLIFFLFFFENIWKLYDKHFLYTLDVKLSDIDQGMHKHNIQKNRNSQHFWKKNFKWKEKKPILSYPGLRYAHKKLYFACQNFFFEKCLFAYKIWFLD